MPENVEPVLAGRLPALPLLPLRPAPWQFDLGSRVLQEVLGQLGCDRTWHVDDARLPAFGQGEVQTAAEQPDLPTHPDNPAPEVDVLTSCWSSGALGQRTDLARIGLRTRRLSSMAVSKMFESEVRI
ncbi:hypothetical protein [Streptomyces beijiangensis]|uniref:Uncharacterized protein n=1 Tax=Streptomyces beijiangensis TaxID=163361 RepID=A0A939F7M6_9ACTN|nr:hypothetical protein [Streptomyces beijiangensis]MBO0513311.1 hypothetical protein [Streptomyces beijiangensis]